jgi:hypothetical protein
MAHLVLNSKSTTNGSWNSDLQAGESYLPYSSCKTAIINNTIRLVSDVILCPLGSASLGPCDRRYETHSSHDAVFNYAFPSYNKALCQRHNRVEHHKKLHQPYH